MFWIFLPLFVIIPVAFAVAARGGRRRQAFPSCGRCGYDVTASLGQVARCPECGTDFGDAGILPRRGAAGRTHQRAAVIVLGAVAVMLILGAAVATLQYRSAVATQQAMAARAQAIALQQQLIAVAPAPPADASRVSVSRILEDMGVTVTPERVDALLEAANADE